MASAHGIIMLSSDIGRSRLVEYGGHIRLGKDWAYLLQQHMSFVKRKATTAKSKYMVDDFKQVIKLFCMRYVTLVVQMEEIPPEPVATEF